MKQFDFSQNPFLVVWETTRACQLACKHCRAVAQKMRDPRELTTDEAKRLLDDIYAMGNPVLVLSGGDPLERPDLFELIEYGTKRGLRVSITPSATPRVTREAIARAKQAGLARWAFSLDGSHAGIHDKFRGTPGSFDLTVQAIRWLQDLQLPLQINTTVSRDNLGDLEEMASLVERLQAVLWSVFFLIPTGRGQLRDMISPEEHEQVLNWLYELSQRVPFDIKTTEAHHYRRVFLQRRKQDRRSGQEDGSSPQPQGMAVTRRTAERQSAAGLQDVCGGQRAGGSAPWLKGVPGLASGGIGRAPRGVGDGNGFLFISHIGDIYPSGFLPVKCGNIRRDDLASVYRESPVFQALRNPDGFRGKCGYCEFRYICGGSRSRAYAVTGDYLESEPCCIYIPDPRRKGTAVL